MFKDRVNNFHICNVKIEFKSLHSRVFKDRESTTFKLYPITTSKVYQYMLQCITQHLATGYYSTELTGQRTEALADSG